MVTLALSQSLFLTLGKELVEVEATGLGAEITTHFFPLSAGLMFSFLGSETILMVRNLYLF